jgi:hypothetical protein
MWILHEHGNQMGIRGQVHNYLACGRHGAATGGHEGDRNGLVGPLVNRVLWPNLGNIVQKAEGAK